MRRQGLMLLILIPLVLISCGLTVASGISTNVASGDWTMFRQNPSHTGAANSNLMANSAKLLWSFTTMEGVLSSPSVAGGCVYAGEDQGALYCLNASNGALVWDFWANSEVASSPAVCNGVVYFGAFSGNFYALNATDGAKLWNCSIGSSVEPGIGDTYSSPAVAGGVVYVGSYDGNVYALNATDGTKLWSQPTCDGVESSPAVSDDTVYVSSGFFVYALNASTGSQLWCQHTGSTISSPCVSDGCVYVGSSDGYICDLNASTGKLIWEYLTQDAVMSSPAVASGRVYAGSDDNNLYCLNASSGKLIWRTPTGYWVWSSPAVADGSVYVGSEDNNIYCFNASTGAKEWSYETGNFVDSSPAIVNNTLYVGSDDGHVYAFTLFDSTAKNNLSQSTSPLPWTTIAFDTFSLATIAVAASIIVLFTRSTQRAKSKAQAAEKSGEKPLWLSTHGEALCLLAILAFSVIFFVNLGSGPLWVSDEQVYSQWAYHMVKSGDYLTPWAYGGVLFWIGKPPLNMWMMALSYQFLGVNNFSSRVTSAVFGSLSLVLLFYLGKKLYNPAVGFLSAFILGTFTTFYDYSRRAMTDVPFVFFIMASVYFFVLSDKAENDKKYAALSGLFFGLALLTKQVQALLIPLIIFAYLLATKRSAKFLFKKQFTLLWGLALLVFVPWVVYMYASFGSPFWQGFFVFNALSRTITPIEGHAHSYLYYFTGFVSNENIVDVVLLPLAVCLSVFNAASKHAKEDTLILAWMIVVLAVFTFAQTKLYYYILPAFPAFAIAISSLLYTVANKGYGVVHKAVKSRKIMN